MHEIAKFLHGEQKMKKRFDMKENALSYIRGVVIYMYPVEYTPYAKHHFMWGSDMAICTK